MATGSTTPTLPNVPARLTIRILFSDDDIVVIDKPCDLRSVPGHANPPPPRSKNSKKLIGSDDVDADDVDVDNDAYDGPVDERMPTKPQSHRRTAQEAWVEAIKSCCSSENDKMVHGHEESRDISSNGGVASIIGDRKDEQKIVLSSEEDTIKELLNNLGTTSDPSAVPRKVETFIRYCQRNRRRLLPSLVSNSNPVARSNNIDTDQSHQHIHKKQKKDSNPSNQNDSITSIERTIAQKAYSILQEIQRPLMTLPQATEDWESALGQLKLLGYGDYAHYNTIFSSKNDTSHVSSGGDENNATSSRDGIGKCSSNVQDQREFALHVVHRLDCQTSGIMVIARNPSAASFLCQAWRERNSVQKTYLAHVLRWPPYHEKQLREGTIDLPLAASRTERIKWEVRPVEEGGKASLTFWKVYKDHTVDNNGNQNINLGVTLELHPVTGRTHQLRIHSAEIGSGIEGDSLYGDSPIKWFGDTHENIQNSYRNEHGIDTQPALDAERPNTLRLHAYELTFPHPTTGKKVTFVSPKSW